MRATKSILLLGAGLPVLLGVCLIAGSCTDSGNDPLPSPEISDVQPDSAAVGDTVRILGSGFGTSQGGSTVTFGGTLASAVAIWTDAEIRAGVPAAALSGPIVVTVDGRASNPMAFNVSSSGSGSGLSFTNDVQPILNMGCALSGCHRPPSPSSGFDQSTYAGLRAGGQKFGTAVIVAGDSSSSRIIQTLRGTAPGLGRMPYGGPWVSIGVPDSLVMTLARWIQEGALNN